ncbi:uncharacterized protein LOC129906053 [Episyrphus balteatus]|uniref:uncharacterized protein LOC129906053 n=1 Tax=Episyrphus balteatus TaxID=286459 RepID=UPI002486096B|nr:uncharacterized protein LOC129906053 [Episyrphus balteatus]
MEQIDEIKEILIKYSTAEELLDKKLQEIKQEELKSKINDDCSDKSSQEPCKLLNLEEAKLRNSNLIKSLEISKARLRSRSTFSPVEQILQQAIHNYRKKPALSQLPSS